MMAAALALRLLGRPRKELAWMAALLLLFLLPPLPDAQPGRETALLVQPDLSETEDWTKRGGRPRAKHDGRRHGARCGRRKRPSALPCDMARSAGAVLLR